jgi:hypothetical protein
MDLVSWFSLCLYNHTILCFLRAYRAFYILNWIYRYFTEHHQSRWIRKLTCYYVSFFYVTCFYNCCRNALLFFSLDCWFGANSSVCRFLLLLFLKVNWILLSCITDILALWLLTLMLIIAVGRTTWSSNCLLEHVLFFQQMFTLHECSRN